VQNSTHVSEDIFKQSAECEAWSSFASYRKMPEAKGGWREGTTKEKASMT
jgi:hypothetical protein